MPSLFPLDNTIGAAFIGVALSLMYDMFAYRSASYADGRLTPVVYTVSLACKRTSITSTTPRKMGAS
jgi:hypothetical protein